MISNMSSIFLDASLNNDSFYMLSGPPARSQASLRGRVRRRSVLPPAVVLGDAATPNLPPRMQSFDGRKKW